MPQERDALVLADLLPLQFTPTPAATLIFCSHTGTGSRAATERLGELHRSGHLTRMSWDSSSDIASGARPDLLVVENGLAGVTVDARRPLEQVPEDDRRTWETLARADKQRVLDLLDTVGIDLQRAGRLMRYHAVTARALLAGTRSTADHAALVATFAGIVLFNARVNGWEVDTLLGDGEVNLAAKVRVRDAERRVSRKPDLTLVLTDSEGADCYLLEAETGQASVGKVRDKILQYHRLIDAAGGPDGFKSFVQDCAGTGPLRSVRIVFYCQNDAHLDAVASSMAQVLDQGRHGSFALVRGTEVHLDVPALALRNNAADSSGVRVLDRYRNLLQGDVSGTVTVRDEVERGERRRTAEVSWAPLVKLPATPATQEASA